MLGPPLPHYERCNLTVTHGQCAAPSQRWMPDGYRVALGMRGPQPHTRYNTADELTDHQPQLKPWRDVRSTHKWKNGKAIPRKKPRVREPLAPATLAIMKHKHVNSNRRNVIAHPSCNITAAVPDLLPQTTENNDRHAVERLFVSTNIG